MIEDRRNAERVDQDFYAQDIVKRRYLDEMYSLAYEDGQKVAGEIISDEEVLISAMQSLDTLRSFLQYFRHATLDGALTGRHRAKLDRTFNETSISRVSGLPTRRLFDYQCGRLSSQMKRDGTPVGGVYGCVAYIDIDHLKAINDTYGHEYADAVLAKLGKLLSGQFRGYDILGNLSGDAGDEFGIVAPHIQRSMMIDHLKEVLSKFSVPLRAKHLRNSGAWDDFRPTFTFAVEEIRNPDNLTKHIADAERNVLSQKMSRNETRGMFPQKNK